MQLKYLTDTQINDLAQPVQYLGISGRIKEEMPYKEKNYFWFTDCGGTKATTVPIVESSIIYKIVNENTESNESEGLVKN